MLSNLVALVLALTPQDGAEDTRHWPDAAWLRVEPEEVGLDRAKLEQARDYALTGSGSGLIVRSGRVVLGWGDPKQRYDLKSSTKAIGVTALGLAIQDKTLTLDDRLGERQPELRRLDPDLAPPPWIQAITLRHLATQTAGFEKPGGSGRLLFEPGTRWHYSDSGPNWLADCVTLAYRRDINDLLFERVFTPIGIQPADLVWRQNAYRPHQIEGVTRREFGSGISANVDAMARIGLLYLREGRWRDRTLLPRSFVALVRRPVPEVAGVPPFDAHAEAGPSASRHYGLLWWNNNDGMIAGVPRDAFWSWGLYDSLIVVIPSLDLVIARAGQSWPRARDAHHDDVLRPFLTPIAASVRTAAMAPGAPYPPSSVIAGLNWAPVRDISRAAAGSDNWPITWGDDDALYTAYGDGRGFVPFVPEKLSLGLAKVLGPPESYQGVNLRSPTLEQRGDGKAGLKASGLLMADGVLYLWARNAANARLAWSSDHGASWTWAPWRFTTSFGCPSFVQFGPNGTRSRDAYAYLISPDVDNAYDPADQTVLARAPRDRLRDRSTYEFFAGVQEDGQPRWSPDVTRRVGIFQHPGHCGRATLSRLEAAGRYLLIQPNPNDPRWRGGFGIYDAPEPWGPWTTVFLTDDWDVGPGETMSFPPKWASQDGRTLHLVFSGDDSFSVRAVELILPANASP